MILTIPPLRWGVGAGNEAFWNSQSKTIRAGLQMPALSESGCPAAYPRRLNQGNP